MLRTALAQFSRRGRYLLFGIIVLIVVASLATIRGGSSTETASAYFTQAIGIYPGDKVTVLGIQVGKIVRIVPQKDSVRVDFTHDRPVPANVRAVLTAPSLVPVRTLALTPAYANGPQLQNHGTIPISRTAIPVEWDDLLTQLNRLSTALGPNGANKNGALGDLLSTTGANLKGNGTTLRTTTHDLALAMQTLNDNGGNIFGTVRNLEVFVNALDDSSTALARFNQLVAEASATLDTSTQQLRPALRTARTAITDLESFLKANAGAITQAVKDTAPLVDTLASSRDSLAQLLHSIATAISDEYSLYDPTNGSITGALTAENIRSPAELLCAIFTSTGSQNCSAVLAPLLELAQISTLPGGASILTRDGSTNVTQPPTPRTQQQGLVFPKVAR